MNAPIPYVCSDCGVSSVRLWRDYNTFLEHLKLRCCWCAMRHEGVTNYDPASRSGTIGSLVAARPTEDGTFWGQCAGPQESVDAWFALPLRPGAQTVTAGRT